MNKYSILIEWSDEDACYVATVPEFSGVMAHGDTREEALVQIKSALSCAVIGLQEMMLDIPSPRKRKN